MGKALPYLFTHKPATNQITYCHFYSNSFAFIFPLVSLYKRMGPYLLHFTLSSYFFHLLLPLCKLITGTPPDYKNHYPSEEDKRYFIQHYLQEKIRISKNETCVEDTYDKKLKVLYVQVCKCELVRYYNNSFHISKYR